MDEVLRALKYRAWHRGTREADMLVGGFTTGNNTLPTFGPDLYSMSVF